MKNKAPDYVYGRWPVKEALESGPVSKILIARGVKGQPVDEILKLARSKKVSFHWVERRKLDLMVRGSNHQGFLAYVAPVGFTDISSLIEAALKKPTQAPGLLFLDGITDQQNIGSILRSAVFFGVGGVVLPKWRSGTIMGATIRTSAGAARLIPVAQVSNLATAIETAKKKGLWMVGADMAGEDIKKADVPRPFGLVLGAEGAGLHQLIKKKCDLLVSLKGASNRKGIDSLNVGAACAALLHNLH